MGASNSKIEDDKALLLCRERRRYVKEALDGRCSLAAAHVSYIQALRKTGMALGKLVEPEAPAVSSLHTSTSTSGTPEPLTLTDKSASQFSNSSPSLSQHVETVESFSLTPSPPNSGRYHVNYVKSDRTYSKTVEQTPPISATATLQPSSDASPKLSSHADETFDFDATPPLPGTPPWDFFGLFHPIDTHFSLQDGREVTHVPVNADAITRLREEEGIPELEEEVDKSSVNEKSEYVESEDEFDQPSSEPLVRIFKNRNNMLDFNPVIGSADSLSPNMDTETKQSEEETIPRNDINGTKGSSKLSPKFALPFTEKSESEKEFVSENKPAAKDFISGVKEIEELFLKASESGKEVPRMLEANRISFRPLRPENQAQRFKSSTFFTGFLVCCGEETHHEEPASTATKFLTWHHSVSSLSISSHAHLGTTTSRDDDGDASSSLFSSVCMNSGSHASTLDRLYAWERKLYDEVKASGVVRKEYDMKCKLLRDQHSRVRHLDPRDENFNKIEKTRAKVKDLHSRIRVAIHRIDSISKTIEELRDKELQPQLEELIGGLARMWDMMLQCHNRQLSIISMSNSKTSSKIAESESCCEAAMVLEYELNSLYSSFLKWITAHKSYLRSINEWILKCVSVKQKSSGRSGKNITQFSPAEYVGPPIYITCRNWLAELDKLPSNEVADAIKDLVVETAHLMPRQENYGRSKLSSSLSRKIERSGDLTENMFRNEAPVSSSVDLDGLQHHLETLLDRLKTFSERSAMMYDSLGKAISTARTNYEIGKAMNAQKLNG